jgi:hypothetical protein
MDTKTEVKNEGKLKSSPYYSMVTDVDQIMNERFPMGSYNRIDNNRISDPIKITTNDAVGAFFNELCDKGCGGNVQKLAEITLDLSAGSCEFLTGYALGYLKEKYPKVSVECVYLGNTHALLAIGRIPSSSPSRVSTWGKNTILYDFWAGNCYLASDFLKMQKTTSDIPCYKFCSDEVTKKSTGQVTLSDKHYLAGNPEIIVGKDSQHQDSILVKWVAEDQKRFKQKHSVSKKTVIPAGILDRKSVISALSSLSGESDWKFNQSSGKAWFVCKDETQAEEIKNKLSGFSFSEIAIQHTAPPARQAAVFCEQIDMKKLALLAKQFSVFVGAVTMDAGMRK